LKRQANDADSVKSSLLQQVAALEQRTEEERKEYVERKVRDGRDFIDRLGIRKMAANTAIILQAVVKLLHISCFYPY
jgi:hypothetical protein